MLARWIVGLLVAGTIASVGVGAVAAAGAECDETQPYDFDLQDDSQCVSVGGINWGDRPLTHPMKIER
jgi:hypothetical protein